MVVPLGPFLTDLHRVRRVGGVLLQILLRQPALHARTSFISFNDTHGDVEGTTQQTGEEISGGRELADGLRRTLTPLALGVLLRLTTHHAGDLHTAHALRVDGIQHVVVVVLHGTHAEPLHRHLHVRLTCTDPHLSADDVADGQRLAVVEGDRQGVITGLGRLHLHEPFAVVASFRADGLVAPRGSHLHRLTGLGPSPQTDFGLLL